MKVLLLGTTGNLGSRLVPALLTHNHRVVAFVRSSHKLKSLLPPLVYQQITVVEGDATSPDAVKRAILDHDCDAVVSAAGVAALPPWGKSDLPKIFRAILEGVQEAGVERRNRLRVWFMGGLGLLLYPGTNTMLSKYVPIYLEHRQNLALLRSLPPNSVDWSILCPSTLTEESSDFSVPTKASSESKLIANAETPPLWKESWLRWIPLLGKPLVAAVNASRYVVTLEQTADFIATDLASDGSRWIGMTVGVIDGLK